MFKSITTFILKKLRSIQQLLNYILKPKAEKKIFNFNTLNDLIINFEKEFLNDASSYRTLSFNNQLNEIYLMGSPHHNCNYTIRTSTYYNKELTFELYNIYENLPLNIVVPVCKIFHDIEKKHYKNLSKKNSVNIYVEIVVFEEEKGSYFNKVLISENYPTAYFSANINLARNKTIINLLRLLNYYKINEIRLLKILLV